MPLYTYCCPECGKTETAFRKIDDRNKAPMCYALRDLYEDEEWDGGAEPECATRMKRIVEAPAVQTDLPGYQSPIDGRWVEGRRARNEDLKRSNCRPWEGMETERKEAVKRADEADRKFDAQIERGIADTFNNMSAEKQKVLNEALG